MELSFDRFELGEQDRLHKIYHWVILEWLSFAVEIGVPSVRKHTVLFKCRYFSTPQIKKTDFAV